MSNCKLYTNFAEIFNNLKFTNMKQKHLISIGDADLIYMNWFFEYLITKNNHVNMFSRTEENMLRNWQKKIKTAL